MTYIGLQVKRPGTTDNLHVTMAFLGHHRLDYGHYEDVKDIIDHYNPTLSYVHNLFINGYMRVGRNFESAAWQVVNPWLIALRRDIVTDLEALDIPTDISFKWNPHVVLPETINGLSYYGTHLEHDKLYLHQSGDKHDFLPWD